MNSVEDSIAQSIVFLENDMDVCNELKEHFFQGVSELQCEIFRLKQDSRSVSDFFTALKVLWEELEAYLPTPICPCSHRCMCNINMRLHVPLVFLLDSMITLILFVLKSC